MSRQKTVYTSDMVCHLWANRHSVNVRTARDNLYTDGGTLFSYGSHFAIASFFDNPKKGESFIVWNSADTSNTTNKHRSQAWRSLAGWQRSDVVRVPDLNRDTLRKPEELAAACIDAAKKPLAACEKARDRLSGHLHVAQTWFDSARALYTYAGNVKAAAAVPTIDGTDKDTRALKAHAADILRSIARADMLATAKNYVSRAIGDLNAAETRIHLYGLRDQTSRNYPHDVRYSYDTATGICQAANDAILNADKAAHAYKQAAANVPPMVYRTKKKAEQIKADYTHAAQIEQADEMRRQFDDDKRTIVRNLALFRRENKTDKTGRATVRGGRSLSWRVEKAIERRPIDKHAADIWPNETERAAQMAEWSALVRRCQRIQTAASLDNACSTVAAQIADYRADKDLKHGYSVPDSRIITNQIRVMALYGSVPLFWQNRAAPLIAQADAIKAAHAQRVAELYAEKITRWRNGENVSVPRDFPIMVRIVGQTVQTSWGATVPLDHAARLVRIARRVAANGGGGQGERVGHFTVNRINADLSAVIGCHSFTADESRHAMALIEAATAETAQGA